jgi:hypothetical protein
VTLMSCALAVDAASASDAHRPMRQTKRKRDELKSVPDLSEK